MITVKDLTWQYDQTDRPALEDINLQVEAGELLLIMGASGAGKSTLCKTLNGLIPHSYRGTGTGSVRVAGLDTTEHFTSDLAEHVGMVFQDADTQLITMSVSDEIVLGMEHLQVPRREMQARLEEVSRLLRVEDLLHRPPYDLSGGQKQRVAIASILAMQPRVLILDEPTSELDPRGKAELFESIRDLHQTGITIVLVAHAAEEAAPIADRVILIEAGRITREGPPRDFFKDPATLEQKGVRVPQVARIAQTVNSAATPLGLDEAITQLGAIRFTVKSRAKASRTWKGEPVLEVQDLHHAYPDGLEALSGISLSIREGEILAIVGQNGSGKTTLAKHLNRLLKPSAGWVRLYGESLENKHCTEVSKTVGFVFQNPDFQICTTTVHEEARFGLRNIGVPEHDIETAAMLALRMVGLDGKKDEHPFMLSKGERQRLAVATVLAMEPPIIIFDEPTTGQDARQSREIMELIQRLNEEAGKTIVIITHDMELVAEYCPRVVVLSQGKIIADGSPEEVFANEAMLHTAFLRAPQVTLFAKQLGLGPVVRIDELVAERDAVVRVDGA